MEKKQKDKHYLMRLSCRAERKCCLIKPGHSLKKKHYFIRPNYKSDKKLEKNHYSMRPSYKAEKKLCLIKLDNSLEKKYYLIIM